MRIRIIANPISGGGRGPQTAATLSAALGALGVPSETRVTERAGDAGAWAREPGADCVVSVGGDGTLNEVANALAGSGVPIATLPLGTANVVASELRTPTSAGALAQLIAGKSVRAIDTGRIGDRIFLLGAGAGLDAAIVEIVHKNRGKRLSFLSYVWPAVKAILTYDYPRITVTVDGETVCDDAHYVIVGNCSWSAGVFRATPKALLDDGLLDVCILRNLNVAKILWLIVLAVLPGFADRKSVMYRQGRDVNLESTTGERVPLQIDGDPAGELPAAFTVEPRSLHMVAPQSNDGA
ncbi:MAG: diacylglycerol kinase family lipid kinase [Candidatus Hydrogenedentes bacterium]|nr:diacylglycerol kinase family lipid kinase [Candidatus Hydrogenedentota bacterium]